MRCCEGLRATYYAPPGQQSSGGDAGGAAGSSATYAALVRLKAPATPAAAGGEAGRLGFCVRSTNTDGPPANPNPSNAPALHLVGQVTSRGDYYAGAWKTISMLTLDGVLPKLAPTLVRWEPVGTAVPPGRR